MHAVDAQPLHGGKLTLLSGPERIEAGWFDGALAVRDYFVAVGPDHRLRWIYREAAHPPTRPDRRLGAAPGTQESDLVPSWLVCLKAHPRVRSLLPCPPYLPT